MLTICGIFLLGMSFSFSIIHGSNANKIRGGLRVICGAEYVVFQYDDHDGENLEMRPNTF